MFNLKTISVGLSIFLVFALSLLAYTNTGKQLTRILFRNTDVRLQALYTCPEQFERLAHFSNEIKTFDLAGHTGGITNNIDSLLSKSDDTKLVEIISTHVKEIETLEAPLNDEERIYYEDRFPTNFSAQADCETFYNRRVFWEMFKKTSFYGELSSDQHISLKNNYEQSFEDQLKKQVQTYDPY